MNCSYAHSLYDTISAGISMWDIVVRGGKNKLGQKCLVVTCVHVCTFMYTVEEILIN